MSKYPELGGVFAYPVTPTSEDGAKVDEIRLCELIDEFVDAGARGIVVLGSTGAMTTEETRRLSLHAESVGAAGLQIVPMSHWPLTEAEIFEHYRKVGEAVSIPIAVHNCPSLTGIDMKPALLARLTEIDNVRFLKEGSGDQARAPILRRLTQGKVPVWQDSETMALHGLLGGAEVWATMTPNLFPRPAVQLYELASVKKDVDGARRLFAKMFPVIEFVFERSGVRAIHTALEILGRPAGAPRRPIRMLGKEDRARLEGLLRECEGLIRWS